MKPNLKTRQQLVKTTFDGQTKPTIPKKTQQKPAVVQQQQFEPLGESIVGQRQFIYFDNNTSGINNNSVQNPLDQNTSLVGTTQKVYFANASSVNRQQFEKDRRLHQQANAFKPSQKIIHEPVQNFNKKPKFTTLTQNSQPQEQEDQNEFLALNNVGKWNKNNKSTVISQEMKKMNNHLQNRLTQTKWAKKKPSHNEQTSKTEKNSSIAKNQSTQINTSANNSQSEKNVNNSMKVVHTTKASNQQKVSSKEHAGTEHSIHVKKGAEKYMEGMSEQAKQRVSSMTSWKQEEKPQEPEEVEDEAEEEEEEQQESSQEQEEQDEQSQQEEEQEDEEDQEGEEQGDDEQSSGEEGWDQPEQQQPQQEEPQQVKQDPFTVPQPQEPPVPQVKAKKWGSKLNNNDTQPPKNTSILVQAKNQSKNQDDPDQIQDLTQGEIPNEQVDPHWEKLQQILLRIQKLVN